MPLKLEKPEARLYGLRGARARRNQYVYCIEGQYVSTLDIAAKLGVNRDAATARLLVAKRKDEPITWESLGYVEKSGVGTVAR